MGLDGPGEGLEKAWRGPGGLTLGLRKGVRAGGGHGEGGRVQ